MCRWPLLIYRAYADMACVARKALENAFSGDGVQTKVTEYRDTLNSLQQQYMTGAVVNTQLSIMRFVDKLDKDIQGLRECFILSLSPSLTHEYPF